MDTALRTRLIGYYRFENTLVLHVTGKDCKRYLNARLTADISAVDANHGCIAAQLNPQGKTEGLFVVLRDEKSEGFFLLADGGDHESIREAFTRYIVADRVTVTDMSTSYAILHLVAGNITPTLPETSFPDIASLPFQNSWNKERAILTHKRTVLPGYDLLIATEQLQQTEQELSNAGFTPIARHEFELARFLGGVPSFPQEVTTKRVFLEAGLPHAIAQSKGCYTGQEVIERADALGKLPRKIRTFSAINVASLPQTIEKIRDENEKEVGTVLSHIFDQKSERFLAFISIKTATQSKQFSIDKISGELLPE